MNIMWFYTLCVLCLWFINPELRRLHDWRFGFSSVELISLLPLLSLFPHVWSLTMGRGWQRLPRSLGFAAWLWIGGFTYALVLAILSDNLAPGCYAFINFVLPIGLGLWIATQDTPFAVTYNRITNTLFVVTTLICLYGIIQYVILPPWDALWLQNVTAQGSLSFGSPHPFEVRVFSTLNSPGPFGNFVAVMLLAVLPKISIRNPWILAMLPVWIIAFFLSLDRSGWIIFVFGLLIYTALTPQRRLIFTTVGISTILLIGAAFIAPDLISGDNVVGKIGERLQTLTELDADRSANDRQVLYAQASQYFIEAPFGRGLGIVGTSTKLGDSNQTTDFDSGILARVVEMGFPGAILFFGCLIYLFNAMLSHWKSSISNKNIIAMALAIEFSLCVFQLSGDMGGLPTLLLWLYVSLALRNQGPLVAPKLKLNA